MSYDAIEVSINSGKPIEFYDIYDVEGTHYRHHTAYETLNLNGSDYEPGIINRSDLEVQSFDMNQRPLEVKLAKGNTFASKFIGQPIDSLVNLILYRWHEDDEDYVIYYQGNLIHIGFDTDALPTCKFESILMSSIRMGHRRRCSRICDLVLYGFGCNVNQESYKVNSTITNISADGRTITSAAFATKTDGWFIGGKIRIGYAYRLIIGHSTNTILIDRPFYNANLYDVFTAFAGCGHNSTSCTGFGNKINYAGNEFLPKDNPFEINIETNSHETTTYPNYIK